MTKLRELERRLKEEPDNLGLRVMVAGAMREAGRHAEAVELYRSVAIAYRDQGRSQQAIAVCRSIVEIAPDDPRGHALLAMLVAGHKSASQPAPAPGLGRDVLEVDAPAAGAHAAESTEVLDLSHGVPVRISQYDDTPLPAALPYHVADPTVRSLQKISAPELPLAEDVPTRPGAEDGSFPQVSGIANAARRISATLIGAGRALGGDDPGADLETRRRPRIERAQLGFAMDDDAQTYPRDLPLGMRRALPLGPPPDDDDPVPAHVPAERSASSAALAFAFFAPLPADRRGAALARFSRRSVPAGTTVIRQGEQGHPLVLVASGRLEVRAERSGGGGLVELGPIGTGEHVGEAALLARAPAPAHVVAATEAELFLLAPRDFYELAGAFPALRAQLKELAERRTREHAARLGR